VKVVTERVAPARATPSRFALMLPTSIPPSSTKQASPWVIGYDFYHLKTPGPSPFISQLAKCHRRRRGRPSLPWQ